MKKSWENNDRSKDWGEYDAIPGIAGGLSITDGGDI